MSTSNNPHPHPNVILVPDVQEYMRNDLSNRKRTSKGFSIDLKFTTTLPPEAIQAYENIPKVLNLSGIVALRSSYVQEGRSRVDLYGGDETIRMASGVKWTLHMRTNKTMFQPYMFWLADNVDDEIKSWEAQLDERLRRKDEAVSG
ncbi:hypothetical protein I302_104843 [Kwoniella bestiolae CBS 10118]|uniref:Uncharacterized protein n=1 Tax=Kwoniella bestiolae CBS 10118 TaxID=1296100 RepID=A0A1B9FRL0_9TREE|nr:hypothetical protein I302_09088 [Kwoniella bestiolae CBS 10118]OCF21410.1 hypothetical protein I302_09088 [Kwoniella bestiolae CBS 10118]